MKTQLLLALRILRRRKFFTFISLFGISFTIMALVVIAAMGDAALGDNPPLTNRDELVFTTSFRARRMVPDTTYIIDSSRVSAGGATVYDSTYEIGSRAESNNSGGVGYYLFDRHLRNVPGVQTVTYYVPSLTFDAYPNGIKYTVSGAYTDAEFWQVFDFQFIAGAAYSTEVVQAGTAEAIITDEIATRFFGRTDESVVGQSIALGDRNYEVAGIIATPRTSFLSLNRGVFLPYTTSPAGFDEEKYLGGGRVIFRVSKATDRAQVATELNRIAGGLQALPNDNYNLFTIQGLTFMQQYSSDLLALREDHDQGLMRLLPAVLALISLFLLLPALNLTNVNLSRVYERSAEIAVRKSFGATRSDILRQFLVESLVVTVIGAAIGIAMGLGVMALANAEGWIQGTRLAFTPAVALWSAVAVIVFGLLTGVLPAYRTSQTHIATSLR